MSPEQLLKPRYKIIALWPKTNYKIGDTQELGFAHLWNVIERQADFWDQYPHLFKQLHWSELRELEELPQFIKMDGKVWKIDKWRNGLIHPIPVIYDDQDHISVVWYFHKTKSEPATLEEYNNYINSKK